jgi:hypothetical protein
MFVCSENTKNHMKYLLNLAILTFAFLINVPGQNSFNYSVELEAVDVPGLPGLHSYAFGQHDGKWLILGGRKDGMHARQPMFSFPQTQNNTDIFVVDINAQQFWSASLNSLPTGINEQLQSTNMNFYQDNDTLYIIGGYAFSATANQHITFENLTSIQVNSVIDAIINGDSITPFFKQINDPVFAITGGQLGKIDDVFYLVGGQKFDGLYNPMGGPTFTQTYSNQIQKFTIDNRGQQLSYGNYSTITDPVHLRRRDYNLLPQIFPDGSEGYTISSGVFQANVDLPFLYPVDISTSGYTPITTFNQYLSNYHSAKAALFDSSNNEMHSLFFGGMSQYYYQNANLIQDDQVPFVKTISRLTRFSDGTLQEFQLPVEMPGLKGASAEFIPNENLPHYSSEILKLDEITQDSILIGHIYGGISSPILNPFSNNQTSLTSADPTIYAVTLIRNAPVSVQEIDGENPYSLNIYPNPTVSEFTLEFNLDKLSETYFFLSNTKGQIIKKGRINAQQIGLNKITIKIDRSLPPQTLLLTVIIDNKFFITKKIRKE